MADTDWIKACAKEITDRYFGNKFYAENCVEYNTTREIVYSHAKPLMDEVERLRAENEKLQCIEVPGIMKEEER